MPIAPWLQLPNFQQAAEAGARIGLQQRTAAEEAALGRAKLGQAAAEAAGKLGLEYAHLGADRERYQNAKELAQATLALRGDRYSDLNDQAGERHDLGEERLAALKENRSVVNQIHQDSQDALNEHRSAMEALRSGGRVGGGSTATSNTKPYMVKVSLPDGTSVNLPSNDPRAQEYINKKFETPIEEPSELYQSPPSNQTGETLPISQAVQSLQPRNQTYFGSKADAPPGDKLPSNIYMGPKTKPAIAEPAPMPPETLPTAQDANPAAKPIQIKTKSERDKLAAGTKYVGPDGTTYIKQ